MKDCYHWGCRGRIKRRKITTTLCERVNVAIGDDIFLLGLWKKHVLGRRRWARLAMRNVPHTHAGRQLVCNTQSLIITLNTLSYWTLSVIDVNNTKKKKLIRREKYWFQKLFLTFPRNFSHPPNAFKQKEWFGSFVCGNQIRGVNTWGAVGTKVNPTAAAAAVAGRGNFAAHSI